jgi:hypothetical protein
LAASATETDRVLTRSKNASAGGSRYSAPAAASPATTQLAPGTEVREVFTVAGDPDVLVLIRLENVADPKDVVNALGRSGRVTGTKTLMVLDHWSRAGAGETASRGRSGPVDG